MLDNWFYTYHVKYYDEEVSFSHKEIERSGFLQATSLSEAFQKIVEYYGEDNIIGIQFECIDLEALTEVNEDTFPEINDLYAFCANAFYELKEKENRNG